MTNHMPMITIGYGSILILIGVLGYFGTGQTSLTALIPAGLGIVAEICGVLARNERLLKHAMHGAAMVGLIGVLGAGHRFVPALPSLLDGSAERPAALIAMGATMVLSIAFVALCVRSFIEARRAREAGAA